MDEDPEPDLVRLSKFSGKTGGLKGTATATDGSPAAKAKLHNMIKNFYRQPGNWSEVSDAMAHVLINRHKFRPVEDEEQVRSLLPDKEIQWHGEHPEGLFPGTYGWYTRLIGGKPHTKTVVGNITAESVPDLYHQTILECLTTLSETVYNLTLFHGTPAKNISKIVQSGKLVAKSPRPGITKGVYLTSDFELAARYAMDWGLGAIKNPTANIPVVLELVVSGRKRVNRVKYDPLDRQSAAWDEEGSDDLYEATRGINYDLRKVLGQFGITETGYLSVGDLVSFTFTEPEDLVGVNIIKSFLDYIKANYPSLMATSARQVKQAVVKTFSGKGYDQFDIADDGTIKLSQDWYESREQLLYPRDIPLSAIKAFWIRKTDFEHLTSHSLETKKAGLKLLPQEARGNIEEQKDLLELIAGYDGRFKDVDDETLDDWVGSLREFGLEELIPEIDKIREIPEEERETTSVEGFDTDLFYQIAGDIQGEGWSHDQVVHTTDWIKVPATKLYLLGK